MVKLFLLLLAFLLLLFLWKFWRSNSYTQEASWEKKIETTGVKKLEIKNITGKISLQTHNENTLIFKARKKAYGHSKEQARERLSDIQIHTSREGAVVRVRTEMKKKRALGKVSYQIVLPHHLAIIAENVTGSISFKGKGGDLELNTVTGSISFEGEAKSLKSSAVTGKIAAAMASLEGTQAIRLNVTTGKIKILLPEESAATIRASVTTGKIRSELGGETSGNKIAKKLSKEVGGGGTKIEAHVVTGAIELKKSREHAL